MAILLFIPLVQCQVKGGNDVTTHLHVGLTKCGAPKIVILIENKKVINNEILGFQLSLKIGISI